VRKLSNIDAYARSPRNTRRSSRHPFTSQRAGAAISFKNPKLWTQSKDANTPGAAELRAELERLLALPEHAHRIESDLIKIFREQSLVDSNGNDPLFHKIIFTPPYEPNTQPRENLWGYSKNSRSFIKSRGVKVLRHQTRMGFYGDGKRHWPFDKAMATKFVARSTRYVNEWLASDQVLRGCGELGALCDQGVRTYIESRDAKDAVKRETKEALNPAPEELQVDESVFGAGDREDSDPVEEKEEPPIPLYCTCLSPYDPNGEDMIVCDKCENWFHYSCVSLTARSNVVRDEAAKWLCKACVMPLRSSPLPARKRKFHSLR
jgi:hypothetical protein